MRYFWLLFFLAGCMIGPDHCPPEVCLVSEYEQTQKEEEKPVDLARWWQELNDSLLDELIEEALACNFDFLIALEKIEELRAQFRIEKSPLYPQIMGDAAAIRARRSENLSSDIIEDPATLTVAEATNFSGPLIQNFFQFGLDAAFEIDFWGKNKRRAEAAQADWQASQENALDVRITLIADVARAYIDIRAAQTQIGIQEELIARQAELYELAEVLYRAGITNYLDVTRAEAALDAEKAALPPLKEELKNSIFALAAFLGREPEGFSARFDEYRPIPLADIPQTLPSELLCRRPDIRQAERELAAATARIGQAKAELFPSFSLTGGFGVQGNKWGNTFEWPSRFWTIGPTAIWNLFNGGRLIAQVDVQTQQQKQAILFYEKAINDALVDVEISLTGFFKQKERLGELENQVENNQLLRALTLDQYLSGLVSFNDVLRAEQDLFTAENSYATTKRAQATSLVALYKALGGGWQCSD